MKATQFFGYGSLLSLESLQATVPGSHALTLGYIKGFRRDFSKWDEVGFKHSNPDVGRIPYCAVDVEQVDDPASRVNGVLFSVDQAYVEALVKREEGYKMIKTKVYDFNTDKPLGECFVFSACTHDGNFELENVAQARYLEICLSGAKSHGDAFYDEFLQTTYIGGKRLSDHPELIA
jgi:hypothetical protein